MCVDYVVPNIMSLYVLKNCTSFSSHVCWIQRQNVRYFRCPVWKTKSW